MAVTSNTIANQAVQLIGNNQPPITGNAPNFDTSANGIACAKLYDGVVTTVQRQFGWDASRNLVTLTPSGNSGNVLWAYEYLYPSNGIEVWQLVPPTIDDPNDPLPQEWNVANNEVGSVQRKVIQTNLAGALAVYNNNPTEATWDPLFRESVVRLLASELATATAGKPETAQGLITSGAAFESLGEGRAD